MATNLIYYAGQYYIYITLYNKIIFMCKQTLASFINQLSESRQKKEL
jgi:hypothetical protein